MQEIHILDGFFDYREDIRLSEEELNRILETFGLEKN